MGGGKANKGADGDERLHGGVRRVRFAAANGFCGIAELSYTRKEADGRTGVAV